MPLYTCQCSQCGSREDIFRSIADRNNDLPLCCNQSMKRIITPILVSGDIEPFVSPIDNSVIGTRQEIKEHCKVHDVIHVGNDRIPPKKRWKPDRNEIVEDIKKSMAVQGCLYE